MILIKKRLIAFVGCLLLSACSVYDPSLLTDRMNGDASSDSGGPDSGRDSGRDSGNDARVPDSGDDDGGDTDGGGTDGGGMPGCVLGLDSDCAWICPETCNGLDDDCDGEVDEGDAADVCRLANAEALCYEGACFITNCTGGFVNCDRQWENGCEATLDSPENCGLCGNSCDYDNAIGVCNSGVCAFGECADGFGDCDSNTANGCETPLDSLSHCGACDAACGAIANGMVGCIGGACDVAECDNGWGNCDDLGSNGCETDLLSTVAHCNTCGNICMFETAEASCSAGFCVPGACSSGRADCNGEANDGCEVSILDDEGNCGGCGVTCNASQLNNTATAECVNGVCTPVDCADGFGDCDNNPANGCETSLRSLSDCGTCGTSCARSNASASCATGTCTLGACDPLFANCDNNAANGCERPTNTLTDCGACGVACTSPSGTPSCASGVCSIADCASPLADCDGDETNGCEVNTNTNMAHCGGCNAVCAANATNGSRACVGGQCVLTCANGFGNCDGNPANGCEQPLNTLTHCGGCGVGCSQPNGSASCATGTCQLTTCNPGFDNCTSAPGCETPLNTLSNCNGCNDVCSLANASQACVMGSCNLTQCNTGFGNCDNNPVNGCETPLDTLTNCNGCGVTCNLANASESCATRTCRLSQCNSGFANCDGNEANGCEVNTNNSLAHCGGCNAACDYANASESCNNGTCTFGTCTSGFANCDSNLANGCEQALNTVAHCGGCNVPCARTNAQATCATGSCGIQECNPGFGNCDSNNANGCETTLGTQTNCGACGNACVGEETCVNFQCRGAFPYDPTNFNPSGIAGTATVTLNCGVSTFNSATLAFGNWCGQPMPSVTTRQQTGGPDVIVLGFDSFTVAQGATLRLDGDKPIIIAAFGNVTVSGTINASANMQTSGPSGVTCSGTAGGNRGATDEGASGGGGGGFGTVGGGGGSGDRGAGTVTGGAVAGNAQLSPLRGGCVGGRGGNGHPTNNIGREGGGAGGAVQLSVAGTLTISGTAVIAAAGGGGLKGGSHEDGGGGGGSGGAILLEANAVTVATGAWITANGGSGAGGNDSNEANANSGNNGNLNNANRAAGGTSDAGGNGGLGAAGTQAATNGANGASESCGLFCTRRGAGGGGGGGGAGRIRIRAVGICAFSGGQSPNVTRGGTCALPASDCVHRTHNNHGYWFCPTGAGWVTASGLCQSASMRLVRIDNMTENNFVLANLGTATEAAIGGSDAAVEGVWRWENNGDQFWMGASDGSAVGGRFANWGPGEPNEYDHGGGVGEDCAYIRVADGLWNDNNCSNVTPYICESL